MFYNYAQVPFRKKRINTEAKLHFAYTSKNKNLTDNATGKNWMSKTLSLQKFLMTHANYEST